MKGLTSWLAIGLSTVALTVSIWPDKNINAERIVLKDKSGVVRAVLNADSAGVVRLFSEDGKEMFNIAVVNEGAQSNLRGEDGRQRVRLSTWGSNYLSIMDESWERRITLGDMWYQDGERWKTKMGGLILEKDGEQEVVFQIPE